MKPDKDLRKLNHDFYCIKSNTIHCGLNPCDSASDKKIRSCKQCDFYKALYYPIEK